MTRRIASIAVAAFVVCCLPLQAEEQRGTLEGEISLAYRNVNVDGSDRKYDEDFDGLESGTFIESFSANWLSAGDGMADYARLDVTGLGGEPFEGTWLRVGRKDSYELSFNHTKQDYIYNLFELVSNEDGATWDAERRISNLRLDVHGLEKVDLFFEYQDGRRSGHSLFMKDISRQLFQLETPLDVNAKRYTVGADFEVGSLDVLVRHTIRRYDNHFVNETENDLGLEAGSMTVLNEYHWDQRDRGGTDWTTVKVRAPLGERVDLTVGLFGTFAGEEDLRSRVDVNADGTDFAGMPLSIVDGFSDAELEGDTTLIDADLSVRIRDDLDFHLQYRDMDRDLDGVAVQDLNGTGSSSNVAVSSEYQINTTSAILDYRPMPELAVRAGYRTIDRELERSGFAGLRDLDYESDGDDTVIFGLTVRPADWIKLNADYEDGDVTQPFNAVAPQEREHTRFRAVFTPDSDMRIDVGYLDYEYTNTAPDIRDTGSFWDGMQEGTTLSATFWHRADDRIDYTFRYAEQEIDSAVGVTFDTAGFFGTETGDSIFATDNTQYSGQVNVAWEENWSGFARFWYAESDGSNILTGDATPPPGIVNNEIILQEFENVEVGVNYTLKSGIFVGASVRTFDYDDANDLLDYEGEMLLVRVGTKF